jgi:hypothetical protein
MRIFAMRHSIPVSALSATTGPPERPGHQPVTDMADRPSFGASGTRDQASPRPQQLSEGRSRRTFTFAFKNQTLRNRRAGDSTRVTEWSLTATGSQDAPATARRRMTFCLLMENRRGPGLACASPPEFDIEPLDIK